MAKRINISQLRSKFRQLENKRRQAVNKYNQAVRQYNQNVKRAAADTNRAINKYNQEVRAHNTRVRQNRARINAALSRFQSQQVTRYPAYRSSTQTLHESYTRLEARSKYEATDSVDSIFALSERENANSLETTSALLDNEYQGAGDESEDDLASTKIADELRKVEEDLHNRWLGALFSLNPRNPDAARHFCTSAREIFTRVLDTSAPDQQVRVAIPNCDLTPQGTPTRRSKIHFMLGRRSVENDALEEFVENDISNIVELFRVFNDGTHGSSGTFTLPQLFSIKRRVEDGILFLCSLSEA
ncbi:hypothetical protein B1C78_06640 [Thioalkalivibrio denitrificans]|uniref:Predicted pPIWI-associating nuclease domain-containing protein n=1 Tax=Thioalkalivibrio denitrificans TaxID=108003 RepID=A0A1V3NK06_9GAMM|nr:hypothetical protein [Thioalkalivibrio denitrificans]OOG25391.1 hypothetical protein B1C78_06640 [Thioalkalivibrio denitrificans]